MGDTINIYTDGACSHNPGKGGWAAVLTYREHRKEISGGEISTTNNRMELTAVVKALSALKEPSEVTITTDSRYCMDGATKWLPGWKKNSWRKADKKPVLNSDLWQAYEQAAQNHKISWQWVKGHAGHIENERVDTLAREEIQKL